MPTADDERMVAADLPLPFAPPQVSAAAASAVPVLPPQASEAAASADAVLPPQASAAVAGASGGSDQGLPFSCDCLIVVLRERETKGIRGLQHLAVKIFECEWIGTADYRGRFSISFPQTWAVDAQRLKHVLSLRGCGALRPVSFRGRKKTSHASTRRLYL